MQHAVLSFPWWLSSLLPAVQPALPGSAQLIGIANAPSRNTIGPDLIVSSLQQMESYGTAFDPLAQKLRAAFAVATTSCNLGDEPAVWYSGGTGTPPGFGNQHPVIAQNMFRLHNSRFEQIGMAWLKHGFFATQQTACGQCTNPLPEGNDGYLLGVGCSDPYSTSLNGQQTNLGPRSEVNGFTGNFPFPFTGRGQNPTNILQKRLLVDDTDVDPILFPGAQYFVEGHYVTPDDAQEGNGNNNSAYRPITRSTPVPGGICRFLDPENPNERCFTVTGFTRLNPAIYAWREADASVQITEIDVPEMVDPGPMGFMLLGAKSIDLGNGFWRYEYALQNVNSHRSAGSFRVPLPTGAIVQNAGFHDVFYHSGEENLYDQTDWSVTVTLEQVIWATTPFSVNPNANALRWSTMYNFRFDANVAPQPANVVVGLFRPVVGLTDALSVNSIGPTAGIVDCNSNGIPDACDLSCGAPGCVPPCGGSDDCNLNSVPDDCDLGACCSNDGACSLNLQGDCATGSWAIGLACEPNPCLFQMDASVQGCRYLSARPNPSAFTNTPIAIEITSSGLTCMTKYVAIDSGIGRLTDFPTYAPPGMWGDLVVADGELIPGVAYDIRVQTATAMSDPVTVTLRHWGDVVEPWDQVSFVDIAAAVGCFRQAPGAPPLSACDLAPAVPDQVVDFVDIAATVSAFQGVPYPYPSPCP